MTYLTSTSNMSREVLEQKHPPSGHVFRVERKRGPAWYAKYRLPDGRQVQRRIGPAWTGRGRRPAGVLLSGWLAGELELCELADGGLICFLRLACVDGWRWRGGVSGRLTCS